MSYCKVQEVENIKAMHKKNKYIYMLADPASPMTHAKCSPFLLEEIYSVQQIMTPENSRFRVKIPSEFINLNYQKDVDVLQPMISKIGKNCSLKSEDESFPYYTINNKSVYLNEHKESYMSGMMINVRNFIFDFCNPANTTNQKMVMLKQYNSLLEYGYVNYFYANFCTMLQNMINNELNLSDEDKECTRECDSFFGYIYQEYVLPVVRSMQDYFLKFNIDDVQAKNDRYKLFKFNDEVVFDEQDLKELDIKHFQKALMQIYHQGTIFVQENQLKKSKFIQSSEERFYSMLQLLTYYNQKVIRMMGPEYKIANPPKAKSFKELLKNYTVLKDQLGISTDM